MFQFTQCRTCFLWHATMHLSQQNKSIRVWAWFTSNGGGFIALLNHLSERQFLELVEEELIPQAVTRFGIGPVGFVKDGEFRVSFETFNQFQPLISFKQLKWPATSKHLSPFITIWPLIKLGIRGLRSQPRNAEELWDYISIMWERRTEQLLFWEGLTTHLQVKLRFIVTSGGEITEMEQE